MPHTLRVLRVALLLALVLTYKMSVEAKKSSKKSHKSKTTTVASPTMETTKKTRNPTSSVHQTDNIEKVEAEIEAFVDEEDLEPFKLTTIDDFKNSTSCAELGYPDISIYMYALPVRAKYGSSSSADVFLPVLSTHNLEIKNRDVKKIVLALHGKAGDADTYFCLGA